MNERMPNWKIATLAVWKQGGAGSRVDTEDIAALCWDWAPTRFGWKKYPQFPDIRVVGEALRDAKKTKNGQFVDGDEREGGWMLTEHGNDWARHQGALELDQELASGSAALSLDDRNRLSAMKRTAAFGTWLAGNSVNRFLAADSVELTADAPRKVFENRVRELQNLATSAQDHQSLEFLKWLLRAE